jgi:hypothetical protein
MYIVNDATIGSRFLDPGLREYVGLGSSRKPEIALTS